jgi:hypothetical protein
MAANPFDQFDVSEPAQALAPGMANPFDAFLTLDHPAVGPSGDLMNDTGRFAGTVAANAAAGTLAPARSLLDIGSRAQDAIKRRYGVDPGPPADTSQGGMRDSMLASLGTSEYVPETWLGRRGMDAATGAVMGLTGGLRSLPASMLGAATGGAAAEMFPKHPLVAAMLGFIPGAYAGQKLSNFAVRPGGGTMDPETAALAQEATQTHDIPLASGQLSTNPAVRFAYSEGGKLPFSGSSEFGENQRGAFNRAVGRTFGEDAGRITPEVLQQARDRIGNVFDTVAQRTAITFDPQLGSDLTGIVQRAPQVLTPQEITPIANQIRNVIGHVQPGGTITGKAYQALTRKGTPLDAAMSSANPNIAGFGRDIRTALDDALSRSAAPQDLAALQQARAQWKALRTVEPLTLRADAVGGAAPSVGDISPASLRAAVNKSYQMAPRDPLGTVPLNDLAKIGQRFLKEPQDSGTATRSLVHNALGGAGALIAGHEAGLPLAASALGTVGTLGANRLLQALLRSPMLADRQIAASLNPNGFQFTGPSPLARAMLPAAIAGAPYRALPATSASSGRP